MNAGEYFGVAIFAGRLGGGLLRGDLFWDWSWARGEEMVLFRGACAWFELDGGIYGSFERTLVSGSLLGAPLVGALLVGCGGTLL